MKEESPIQEIPETASPPISPHTKVVEALNPAGESGDLGGNFSEYRGVHLEST